MGTLQSMGNEQLDRMEQEALDFEERVEKLFSEEATTNLAAYMQTKWEDAKSAKQLITSRLNACLRRRNSEYSDTELAKIREQGGSEIYMALTDEKANAAASWIKDVLFPASDKPWKIEPTPIPDISPTDKMQIVQAVTQQAMMMLQQTGQMPSDQILLQMRDQLVKDIEKREDLKAKERAERMDEKIQDKLIEGGFYEAFEEALEDLVTYPNCFLKGPIPKYKRELTWVQSPDGSFVPQPERKVVDSWRRVSPHNIFPGPTTAKLGEGYVIELMDLEQYDLYALIGIPGYDEEAIREVLDADAAEVTTWLYPEDSERQALEDRPHEWLGDNRKLQALHFWGRIQGKLLLEYGVDEAMIDDPDKAYDVELIQLGRWTIKVLLNDDPLGRWPYYTSSFRKKPGSFWGIALAEVMKDCQDMCNATARALANNMGLASGPQAIMDISQLPDGEAVTGMRPFKIWQFNGRNGGSRQFLDFFQPNSNASELIGVYEKFAKEADNKTGIPQFVYGSGDTSGALRTASGLATMMNNAAKGIKHVISNIDTGIIEPAIAAMWLSIMQFDDDMTVKGDIKIVAKGSASLIQKEQQTIRRTEFLQATSNPVDLEIMGPEGRAALLRENIKGMDIPVDDIVPPPDVIRERQAMKQQMAMAQQAAAQGQLPPGAPGAPAPAGPPVGRAIQPDGSPQGGHDARVV